MSRARAALMGLILIVPIAVTVAPIAARAAACSAQGSGAYPNDPGYANAENHPTSGNTWDNESWYLYGCTPQTAPASTDPEGASGMSVDQLWNRAVNPNRGRDDVIVAYMEGGVNWRIDTSCELKDRAWLNTANLPFPQDATGHDAGTYDLNGDGVVNVEDYFNDQRVRAAVATVAKSPAGGLFLHHVCDTSLTGIPPAKGGTDITPEDLIVAFGHCQINQATHQIAGTFPCDPSKHFDNDGRGYPNNINGWNFNRDNNDPQTEQSIYHHFDGESAQAVGEGNNGFGGIGLCPQCRYLPIKAGDEAIDRPDRVAEAIVFAANSGVSVMDVTSASLGLTPAVQAAIDYAYNVKNMVVVWASNDFESADHTDGMFYAHVWPGNSITGDHSTRGGATCPSSPFCAFVLSNNTFRSRSSLTSYGPHALFSAPNNDGSTSTGTPTNAGVAALIVSEGKYAAARGQITSPLSADEVKQVVRSTVSPINQPCPAPEPCFSAPAGATFNIQYGYGRPNVLAAANAVDAGHIPPTAEITSPSWYQEIDPTRQGSVQVSADVAAPRVQVGGSCNCQYTWQLQYGLGPQPLDNQWTTFASGSGAGPQSVAGAINFSGIPSSFWGAAYTIDPVSRLTIEQYDVSIRVQVFANGDTSDSWAMGEDRRAIHLHHDPTELPGFPIALNSSGDASPTMADIEGRGWLDTILPTADGSVHAFRPDGSEAPGFPVHTNPAIGMSSGYPNNYLGDPYWSAHATQRPRDPIFSAAAVGDLFHTGALDIVASTGTGYTYAWDGAGRLLQGFPVLNGDASLFGMAVPPPDTPYSFQPENYTAASPVLAHLVGANELDIIQTAGDDQIHAWHPNATPVPGWPAGTKFTLTANGASGTQQTHDSKVVTTPAIAQINGAPVVVVGLDDSVLGQSNSTSNPAVATFVVAYNANGTVRSGYPLEVQGLIQGYGVAQDFVTQGVESPAVYDDPQSGPQAVVNANLWVPNRVNLGSPSATPFTPATIPTGPPSSCPAPGTVPPNSSVPCTLVQFTTSASLGKVVPGTVPQTFQMGSAGVDIVLGVTQTPGFGIRVENGVAGWDSATGSVLQSYVHYIQGLAFIAAPAIADVTGSPAPNVPATPDIIVPTDSAALMAFDGVTGQPAAGFPKWTGGWSVFTPAVGDLMGNGHTDVAAATREGFLHVWSTAGDGCAGNSEAWHWHQNDWNDGHYGTDTRPPSAITDLSVTNQGANDVLSFTAVGDNWKCGTAAQYQLFRSSSAITQDNLAQATPVSVTQTPGPSGTHEVITVPHVNGQSSYAIRAVDRAGNIGPVALSLSLQVATPEFAIGPVSAVTIALLAFASVAVPRRLRRRRS